MKTSSFSILGVCCLATLGMVACSTSETGDDAADDDAMNDDDATDDDDTLPLDAGSSYEDAGDDGTPPVADGGALPENTVDGGAGGSDASTAGPSLDAALADLPDGGTDISPIDAASIVAPVDGAAPADENLTTISVDVGFSHECRALSDGLVQCRGDGRSGQLGSLADGTSSGTWVDVTDLAAPAVQVTVGFNHSCALLDDGRVQCWGDNGSRQLGTDGVDGSSEPLTVAELEKARSVSAGLGFNCALLEPSGEVQCWGSNHAGRLGNGSTSTPGSSAKPLAVVGLEDVVHIDVGSAVACALTRDGKVYCWGHNERGAVGNGEFVATGVPALVNIGKAVDVSTTNVSNYSYISTCAVLEDTSVWCWGDNSYGQLGPDTTTGRSAVPVELTSVASASRVGAGGGHVCTILKDDGSITCWGRNADGQLGNGSTQESSVPVGVVAVPSDATEIAAGGRRTCSIRRGATVCWGQ